MAAIDDLVRRGLLGDLEEVAAFFQGTLVEPVEVLVAEDGPEIAGFAELSIRTEVPGAASDRVGYIEGLYVLPSHRGSGLARQLVAASRRWPRTQGCGAFASDRADRPVVDRRYSG
ncbi:MAG TPA: GNAT family N-acetyltransferase [Thermoanaerobaculia bacterium]|nr:GNAT family N-acetyltransferase [Thermoanaerobaculia bacterium]